MTIPKPIRWLLIATSLAFAAYIAIWHLHEPRALTRIIMFGVVNPLIFSSLFDFVIEKNRS